MEDNALSTEEIQDLLISTAGLGLAFTILFFAGPDPFSFLFSPALVPALLAATAIVAVSFIPHEMAHRVTARTMDAYAEYEMWAPGVVLAVLTSFLGIVFAAPGGVRMYFRDRERYGLSEPQLTVTNIGYISIVGPLTNVALAMVFFFMTSLFGPVTLSGVDLFVLGARINAFLAIFNLLPFYPLDGYKVLRWSPVMWGGTLLLALLTFILV